MPQDTTTGERFVRAFAAGRLEEALTLMADDAVFRSPVTEYAGRERFAPVLGAIGEVVEGAAVAGLGAVDGGTVAFLTAEVAGRPVDGVLRVVAAPDGPATEVTLMLRPLGALLAGVERMKALLAA